MDKTDTFERLIPNLKYAKSNFKLLLPYLNVVDEKYGFCVFRSPCQDDPILWIHRNFTETDDRNYSMFSIDKGNLDFNVYYDRRVIVPTDLRPDHTYDTLLTLTPFSRKKRWDEYLWNWAKIISRLGYTANKSKRNEQADQLDNKQILEDLRRLKKPYKISFDDADHTLYICKGTTSCRIKNHEILPATGILVSLKQKPVQINVNYCNTCRKYFISLDEYRHYRKEFGNLLGNYVFENSASSHGVGFEDMAEKSVLNLCGYNVNMGEDLSAEERHLILENIMVHNIMSKVKIIEYLNMFISSRKNTKNMKSAIQKWSEDLEWVRRYNINNQRKFLITNIKK